MDYFMTMIPVTIDAKLAYINLTGDILLKTEYEYGGLFSEGLAVVGRNKLYGCIGQNGSQVIPLKYDNIGKCCESFFRVMKDNLWGLLHKTGIMTIPLSYAAMGNCANGLVSVQKEQGIKTMYVDTQNNIVIEDNGATVIDEFSEGRVVSRDDRLQLSGFRNTGGKWAINPEYTVASKFSEGYAGVGKLIKKKELTGFINVNGEVILPFEYETTISKFSNGLAIVIKKSKCGAIDKNGTWIIPPDYYFLSDFSDGLTFFRKTAKSKIGFIDTQGVERIGERFITVLPFVNGVAKVKDDNGWVYINKEGTVIWRL
jgi:hypothetical protein